MKICLARKSAQNCRPKTGACPVTFESINQPLVRSPWVAIFLGLLCVGCASRGNVEMLESQLRTQEDQMRELQAELFTARNEAQLASRESTALREKLAAEGESPMTSEEAQVLFQTAGIQINKLLTGGLNEDQHPGDDHLNVVLIPIDSHGDPVKLPGSIVLELSDLSLPDGERTLGVWEFPEEDAMQNWHRGFITSGYQFKLAWQKQPINSKLLLHAQLKTPDGRQFDTNETITITPGIEQVQYSHEKPVPAPPVIQEPRRIPIIEADGEDSLMKNSLKGSNKQRQNSPVGTVSPWKEPDLKGGVRTGVQEPLETSDRRADPIFEAKKRTEIR